MLNDDSPSKNRHIQAIEETRRNPRSRLAIGCHEAGHAVVAHALDHVVSGIEWATGRLPVTHWEIRPQHPDTDGRWVATTLGGYIATKKGFPEKRVLNLAGAASDFAEIDRKRRAEFRLFINDDGLWCSFVRVSYAQAQRIVRDEWDVIRAMGEAFAELSEAGDVRWGIVEVNDFLEPVRRRRFDASPWLRFGSPRAPARTR